MGDAKRFQGLPSLALFILFASLCSSAHALAGDDVATRDFSGAVDPTTYKAFTSSEPMIDRAPHPVPTFVTTKAVVQHPAPFFESQAVVNGDIKTVKLSDYRGKYLVLIFYPLDFTFVCPTELIAYSDRIKEFHEINAEVASVSVDSVYTHLAWQNTPRSAGGVGKMNFTMISDLTKKIAQDYGVLIQDGGDAGASLRGLFIISDKGIVRQVTINDLPVGRNVDETLRLVKAFQYTDVNEVVCPAGWVPGSDTINPSTKQKSLEYFEKHGEAESATK